MENERLLEPGLLLLTIALIVLRQTLLVPPIFRSEFVIEDFILLLALVCSVAPTRFKPLIWSVVSCLMSTTMTFIGWRLPNKLPLAVFAPLAIYSAARAVAGLAKLRSTATRTSC